MTKRTVAYRRWAASWYVLGVCVAGLALLVASAAQWLIRLVPLHEPYVALAFVGCLLVTELRPVAWLRRTGTAEVTASWTFAYALMLVAPIGIALFALWTASLLGDVARRKAPSRAFFNAGQLVVSLAAGAAVLDWLTGSHLQPAHPTLPWVLAACVTAAVIFTCNGVLMGFVLVLHSDRPARSVMRSVILLNLFTDGLLLTVAPIFAAIATSVPALVPLLLVSTWTVYRSACLAEERQFEASHDLLTGIPNRRSFYEEAESAVRIAELRHDGLAIMMIDLDSFKVTNDELGHDIGDLLLQEVARRLVDAQRPSDLVARLGGDEFAVLVRSLPDPGLAMLIAERLLVALRQPCTIKGFPVSIGASVGVASHPEHGGDVEVLMRHADVAMYAAKGEGGGVRAYDLAKDEKRTGRITLLSELSDAIDAGQLILEYQPMVRLATGTITGAEALVRWDHPTLGRISPDQFVPLAEQTDLMHPFTDWVLRRSLADLRSWRESGLDLTVSVNVSAHNLRDPRFAHRVADLLVSSGIDPIRLELEITENTVVSDLNRARSLLGTLREMGVRLAIDDFGTGYSSLSSLRTLPITTVKIDRSFVANVLTDPADLAVVRAIAVLARCLGLVTVAEGIECAATQDLMQQLGCDLGQGYHLSRPLSERDFRALVMTSEPSKRRVTVGAA